MNDVPSAPIGDFENTLSFLHHTIRTLNNAQRIHTITVLGILTHT